jgi:uncharacterized protein (TIGR03000 family)
MYSVVLMAALTSGATAPDCFFRCRHSCGGCYGSSCYGCSGYGSACYGSSCNGCSGYGCSGYGCFGNGYGCYGSWSSYSCWGCYGSSCYGSSCYGSINCHGCYGCYGCYGCTGYAPVVPGTGPAMPPAGEQLPEPKKDESKKKGGEASIPNRAKLLVELPADAKLYIDDQPMKLSEGRRAFQTPDLEKGQSYYYILRAEVVRDGQTISETKRIIVRAGDVVRTDFSRLDAVTTAKVR